MQSSSKTFKWIFFRIINYIQIVVALFVIALIIIGTLTSGPRSARDILYFVLSMLVFGVFIANSLSNLFLLERFFPNQLPPKAASRFNMVMYVLFIILSALLIAAVIAGIFDTFNSEDPDNDIALFAIITFGFIGLTSVPLWFMQMQLRTALKRSYYTTFDEFLETEES